MRELREGLTQLIQNVVDCGQDWDDDYQEQFDYYMEAIKDRVLMLDVMVPDSEDEHMEALVRKQVRRQIQEKVAERLEAEEAQLKINKKVAKAAKKELKAAKKSGKQVSSGGEE